MIIRQSPRHPIEIFGSTTPDSSSSSQQRSSRSKRQPRHRTQSNHRSKSRHENTPKLIKSKSTIDENSLRSRQPTDKLPPLPTKQQIRTLSPILKKPSPKKLQPNNNFLLNRFKQDVYFQEFLDVNFDEIKTCEIDLLEHVFIDS